MQNILNILIEEERPQFLLVPRSTTWQQKFRNKLWAIFPLLLAP
jgi:hypothetical protein